MEMARRVGSGRLSEIIGEEGLGIDRFALTMGFRIVAEKTWEYGLVRVNQ